MKDQHQYCFPQGHSPWCEEIEALRSSLAAEKVRADKAEKELGDTNEMLKYGVRSTKCGHSTYWISHYGNCMACRAEAAEERARKAEESDARHALVCPQHVKNVDPWVRESALKSSEAQVAALTEKVKVAKEVLEYIDEHCVSSDDFPFEPDEIKAIRVAISKLSPGAKVERKCYGPHHAMKDGEWVCGSHPEEE